MPRTKEILGAHQLHPLSDLAIEVAITVGEVEGTSMVRITNQFF